MIKTHINTQSANLENMEHISLSYEKALGSISQAQIEALQPEIEKAQAALENGTGKGNDFLGWLHLPSSITEDFLFRGAFLFNL